MSRRLSAAETIDLPANTDTEVLTHKAACDTMCHMKTISIRELHEKTGAWVRQAAKHGEILITDRGKTLAKILPESGRKKIPYFSNRRMSAAFRKLLAQGKLRGGMDSTQSISEDRDRSAS
jgi:antitoxin (DNA-binding transcriptional repressor) of toxin-antitoxin stability system